MSKTLPDQQLGFDAFLAEADADNRARRFEKEAAHLPESFDEAVPFLRDLIEAHHAAMLAAEIDETFRLREEARRLAAKLNAGSTTGMIAPEAPWRRLISATRGGLCDAPLWGLGGCFEIEVQRVAVRIEMEDMLGIGASSGFWLGFAAHAADPGKPFFSDTGYRSFLGIQLDARPGLTPDIFVAKVVERHIATKERGRRA